MPEALVIPQCWCGERNAEIEMPEPGQSCYGTGELDCRCGGDQCVCHNHGTMECDGCFYCDGDD